MNIENTQLKEFECVFVDNTAANLDAPGKMGFKTLLNDGFMEAALKSLMVNASKCLENPEDYTARAALQFANFIIEKNIYK